MANCDVFISWTGEYGNRIAEAIKITLDQITMPNSPHEQALLTFVSSKSIENGAQWRTELDTALKEASRGLILVTQEAIYSDWLAHEAGALSRRSERPMIYLVDTPATLLPKPLRDYQCEILDNEKLAALVQKLALRKGAEPPSASLLNNLYKNIEQIRRNKSYQSVTADDIRWRGKLERPLLITSQSQSPYDLEELMNVTSKRLILIAQNHGYMTVQKEDDDSGDKKFWPLVKGMLERGVTVQIIAMHADAKPAKLESAQNGAGDALSVWAHYMRADRFFKHVDKTWEGLKKWSERYRDLDSCTGRLQIYRAYFTPITLSVVDPETGSGTLVVSPRPAHDASGPRPQFIVSEKYCPVTFSYYWGTIKNSFDNDKSWEMMFN